MRITLKEPELELEVNKVDTPTGVAWSINMSDETKVLIRFYHGTWGTCDDLSNQFVQAIGDEIDEFLETNKPPGQYNSNPALNPRPKRARILKYLLT